MAVKTGDAAAVAKRLRVTKRTIYNLEKLGMPKQGPGKYDLAACERWYADYSGRAGMPPELAIQRGRWLKAKADREELSLARERGQSVDMDDVLKVWAHRIQTCRSKLLGIPSRVAPEVVACSDIREVHRILQARICETLDELAETKTYQEGSSPLPS